MKKYFLTVYDKSGGKLLDETIQAADDRQAKELGEKRLLEEQFNERTHRLTSPSGALLLFHR
ncbi:YhzD family protein [Fictibacillus fluitans]|uniref:YhzD family protein n=1 Tax=Fictibacillus fluitans TaxID=3058422 RepID=A0ABT8I1R2_9BACL|nr:YhzD family protein [Fictibacillus sp. NE201]MDN4526959.1 YhzD family protein [Fictibacillus sp. NE201]